MESMVNKHIKTRYANYSQKRVDIDTHKGNAFSILRYVEELSIQLDYSYTEIVDLKEKMKSGNYKRLLRIFFNKFGMSINLVSKGCILGNDIFYDEKGGNLDNKDVESLLIEKGFYTPEDSDE